MAAAFAPPRPGRRPAPGESLAGCPVGIVPIIWNNADLPDLAHLVPAAEVLDEIRRLGYRGTQLGSGFPRGEALALELRNRDLRLSEVYAAVPVGADGPLPQAAAVVRGRLAELDEAHGEVLVVALQRTPDRDGCIGRAYGAPGLTRSGWGALGALLDTIAREAHELGHPVAFHNHGATYVETPDEIDRLLEVTDPRLTTLCLDVGHVLLGGGDPIDLVYRYRERLAHVHLKDVDPEVVSALRDGRLAGFTAALRARVFPPLGSGLLDLPGVLGALAGIGYDGWLMVEQDTSWEPPSEAAAIGRHVLDASLRWLAGARGS